MGTVAELKRGGPGRGVSIVSEGRPGGAFENGVALESGARPGLAGYCVGGAEVQAVQGGSALAPARRGGRGRGER